MIPKQVIDDITNQADIVELVGERIQLSKKGRNYWAVCPFHQDSNPSMSVSPEKKIYKCFSCQVSGNIIEFIQNFDNLTFIQAVEKIAGSIDFDLSQYKTGNSLQKATFGENIYQINQEALAFFKLALLSNQGKLAVKYLQSRKISVKEIDFFDIGFVAKQANLVEHLISKGYTANDIIEAGLGVYDETKNKMVDVFADRIMFVIKNENKQIIGFSGRKIEDDSQRPKYLNTRETKVFSKRKIAYNYVNAIKAARIKKELIVLEGYMDVISLHQVGIENTIALMGTTLSPYHLSLFKNVKDGVIKLFLDGDEPGINANIKAAQILLKAKFKTSIIDNASSQDPDELINKNQLETVLTMIAQAINPLDYLIKKMWAKTEPENFESVTEFVKKVADFVLNCDHQILYEKALYELQKLTNLSVNALNKIFKETSGATKNALVINQQPVTQALPNKPVIPIKVKQVSGLNSIKAYQSSEMAIIADLLKSRKHIDFIKTKMYGVKFPHDDYRRIIMEIIDVYQSHQDWSPKELVAWIRQTGSTELQTRLDEIINSPIYRANFSDALKMLDDAFEKIKMYMGEFNIEELKKMIDDPQTSLIDCENLRIVLSERIKKRNNWKSKFSNKDIKR